MKLRIYADVKVKISTEDIHKCNVIYCLTFENGKKYIGLTTQSLNTRLYHHCSASFNIKDKSFNTKKSRAIRKYMNFEVNILYQGDNLNEKEIEFIKEYDTFNKGYNSTIGGEGSKGYKLSDELKQKISIRNKKASNEGKNPAKNKRVLKEINKERLEREIDDFYAFN